MPEKYQEIFSKDDLEHRLKRAIDAWNPTIPRRWLCQYGYLYDSARDNPLYLRYCVVRTLAMTKIRKDLVHYSQAWPVEGFKVAL